MQVIAIVTDRLTDGAIIGDLHNAASRDVAVYIILNQRSIQENFTINRFRHPVSHRLQISTHLAAILLCLCLTCQWMNQRFYLAKIKHHHNRSSHYTMDFSLSNTTWERKHTSVSLKTRHTAYIPFRRCPINCKRVFLLWHAYVRMCLVLMATHS